MSFCARLPALPFAFLLVLCACSDSPHPTASAQTSAGSRAPEALVLAAAKSDGVPQQPPSDRAAASGDARSTQAREVTDKRVRATAGSERAHAIAVRQWNRFQVVMKRCAEAPLSARQACLASARDDYRAAKVNCGALPGPQRKECVKYAKLWADTETDLPIEAEVEHAETAATPPDSPAAPAN